MAEAGLTVWASIQTGDEGVVVAAHFFHAQQPIVVFIAVAQRQQQGRTQTLCAQVQQRIHFVGFKAFHGSAVYAALGSGHHRAHRGQEGLFGGMVVVFGCAHMAHVFEQTGAVAIGHAVGQVALLILAAEILVHTGFGVIVPSGEYQ